MSFRLVVSFVLLSSATLAFFPACGGDEGDASGGDGDGDASAGDGDTGGDGDSGSTGDGDTGSTGDGDAPGAGTGPCFDGTCEGICEGSTCGGAWICNTEPAACTDDLAQYCGCDGQTFTGSGSCPPQAFASRGPCPSETPDGLFNCSPATVTCRALPAPCEEAFHYRAVVDGCWGDCVAAEQCACETSDDCPDPDNIDETFCKNTDKTCSPQLR